MSKMGVGNLRFLRLFAPFLTACRLCAGHYFLALIFCKLLRGHSFRNPVIASGVLDVRTVSAVYHPYRRGKCNLASFELIPYRFDTAGTRITPFTGEEKAKMLEYLATISAPIGDMALSEKYFRGWAISHQLYPKTPTDYNVDKMNFRASNLVRCEAHHECLKMNYQTIKDGLVDEALEWAEKIAALQNMPV